MTAPSTGAEDGDLFAALPEVDEAAQRRLHARLAAAAEEAGILDVAYRTIDTPVGPLLLAATEKGLVRVAYAREDHDLVLEQLATGVSPRVLRTPARLIGVLFAQSAQRDDRAYAVDAREMPSALR